MDKLEKDIETKLRKMVERRGGLCLKWVCPGWSGVPDRMILLPGGRAIFIETKRPKGGRKGPLQGWWKKRLEGLGFMHWYLYDDKGIEALAYILQVMAAEGFKE